MDPRHDDPGTHEPTQQETRQDSDALKAPLLVTERPLEPVPEGPARVPRLRKRIRPGVAIAILTAAVLGGIALWFWLSPGAPPVHFRTAILDRGPITATVTATGTVNPVVVVQVGSQVSGVVQKLFADFNSVVKAGQLIAQINPDPFQAKVKQARANLKTSVGNLEKARNMLAQRKLELDRMARLREQQFVSQADLDLARTNHRDAEVQIGIAQGQVDQARATLASAELDLQYTRIHSPVSGIVVSRNVDVGQTVVASFQTPTLFLIAKDLSRMQVNANVSESDIGGVTEGRPAEFTVDAYPTTRFTGTVVQVRNAPISIQNVVTYDVVANVDNRDLKLKPGMTANVSIETARKDSVLRVPNVALRFKPPGAPVERKKAVVWVPGSPVATVGPLHGDKQLAPRNGYPGQPRAIPIKPGISDTTFTEVLEGEVREGDLVIVGLEAAEDTEQKGLPPGFGVGPRIR